MKQMRPAAVPLLVRRHGKGETDLVSGAIRAKCALGASKRSLPRQLRGLLRNALRVSLEAIRDDAGTDTERDGWKLLLLAPCMLLFRTPGVAHVPPQEFKRREHLFCEGSWTQLLRESVAAAQPAQPVRDAVRAPESPQVGSESDIRRRADRASALAHLGEMSAAAKALTAPPLAPATAETLQALRDPVRRPPEAQVPIHPSVDPMSAAPAQVCKADLLINLRRARRGAAAGPSGCTNEHLRVLMDEETTAELLGHAADRLAVAKVPSDVADALRLGRMVALTKPTGGVRALVMGDVFRRLVARTLARQFGAAFRTACAPFQYALSTRAGSEAVVRAVQTAIEADPRMTVLSIDGVGAYDHISRASMLEALRAHAPLTGLLPFASLFYGQASRYTYYDEAGVGHEVLQGEGGEQGDPLMPGLYALGQHAALLDLHSQLHPGEGLYAFLDDVYITSLPERTPPALRAAQTSLSRLANVQVHLGKTRAWNAAGEELAGLLAALPSAEGEPPCWTGSWTLPAREQGLVVLGSPIGSREFLAAVLAAKRDKHEELLARLPALEDLQSAWLLLLLCAAPRCNYLLRTVPPSLTDEFAAAHDAAISRCLAVLLAGAGQPIDLPPSASSGRSCPFAWGVSAYPPQGSIVMQRTGHPGRT